MAFGRGSLSAWEKDKSVISLKSSSSDLDASGSRSIYSSWSPFAKGKTGSVRNVNSSARSIAALGRSPNYVDHFKFFEMHYSDLMSSELAHYRN